MFEMITGCSPEEVFPSSEEYQLVESEELMRILKYIFDDKTTVKKVASYIVADISVKLSI